MGWTNTQPGIVTANKVIIEGPDGSLYVYNGTPGPGTLLASIVAVGGHDAYGNDTSAVIDVAGTTVIDETGVILGFNTAGSTLFAEIPGLALIMYQDTGPVQGPIIFAFAAGTLSVTPVALTITAEPAVTSTLVLGVPALFLTTSLLKPQFGVGLTTAVPVARHRVIRSSSVRRPV